MRRQFQDRATLTVYLERADLEKFAAEAVVNKVSAADYARDLILAKLNGTLAGNDEQWEPTPEMRKRVDAEMAIRFPEKNDETRNGQEMRGVRDVPVVQGSADADRVIERDDLRFSAADREVARRTGHRFGCGCFQCLQTNRFLKPTVKKQEHPTKKGRR